MTNLIEVLEKTVSPDKNELFVAKNFLEEAAATNLPEFLKALSDVLVNTGNSTVARTAAGLQLKNQLTSKDAALNKEYQFRWLQLPNDTREYIKRNILQSLGTENTRPSSAAQCVAYVAVVELPANQWNYLIQTLVNKVVNDSCSEMERESSLEAIGYICQDIGAEVLENQSNQILTAIVHGMRKNETNVHCRLAATTALLNSLEFTKPNFDKQAERNYIMEVVCESTQNADPQICVTALQCLVKILSLYYQYMEPYMAQALFPITLEAMKSESDPVALQGIEFWSNVCDEEFDLSIENQEAVDVGRLPERVSKHYARGALQYLAPVLMDKLTKQEELDDEDDWNPAKAASVCLMLLSSCCEDEVIPHVLPFIKANIQSDNWRYRDAALMVFGSILGGLDTNTLKPLVEQAMPTLIKLMYDTSVSVRDTTAWTFGRICEIIPEAAINPDNLKPLLESFLFGLKAEPRVASNVCWAITGLAESAYEAADTTSSNTPETYCLSPYFEFIVQLLLETTDRSDGTVGNLRGAAYEALMEMIKNSAQDCYLVVQKTTMVILERLNHVLQLENNLQRGLPPINDRAAYVDIQSLLAATLQSVLRKILPEDAPKISDGIMQALLTMFESASGKYGCVQEDALMAVSTLADLLGEKFDKYMPAFKPYLFIGLRTVDVHQVCCAAVGTTSDLCRALKQKILPYCSEIMQLLMENLSNPNLDRVVKPHILPVFADMALSIGYEFNYYLAPVMDMLRHASELQIDRSDFEMMDYQQELRNSVMEAYTGILQGLKGVDSSPYTHTNILEPYLPSIISFLTTLSQDTDISESNICAACGLIGDLVEAFSYKIIRIIDTEHTQRLINEAKKSRTTRTRNLALWAQKLIRKAKEESNEHPVDPTIRCKTKNLSSNMQK